MRLRDGRGQRPGLGWDVDLHRYANRLSDRRPDIGLDVRRFDRRRGRTGRRPHYRRDSAAPSTTPLPGRPQSRRAQLARRQCPARCQREATRARVHLPRASTRSRPRRPSVAFHHPRERAYSVACADRQATRSIDAPRIARHGTRAGTASTHDVQGEARQNRTAQPACSRAFHQVPQGHHAATATREDASLASFRPRMA